MTGAGMLSIEELADRAKAAATPLSLLDPKKKNRALVAMAKALKVNRFKILTANEIDVIEARDNGLAAPLIGRLTLDALKLDRIAESLVAISKLPDP
ncbi:MAG: glutamate-5-semialdehyde dehydrogenase, partial [Polyangiaceae bacterium]